MLVVLVLGTKIQLELTEVDAAISGMAYYLDCATRSQMVFDIYTFIYVEYIYLYIDI